MKILMISTDCKIFKEGGSVHERMQKYGNLVDELHIIVFSTKRDNTPSGQYKISDNTFAYATNSWNRWLYISDAIKKGKKLFRISDFGFSPRGAAESEPRQKREAADQDSRDEILVTCQDPFEAGFVGYRLANTFGAQLELQVHTDFLSPHFQSGFLNNIRVQLARFLLPKANCIRVVSERIKKSIENSKLKIQNSAISVLPIYVDTSRIESRDPEFNTRLRYSEIDPILLVVSRLEPEKHVSTAIDALSHITDRHPSAGLVIVGDGSEREALEKKARRMGLKNKVKFAGWQENVYSYFYGADVYLHTALFEGYGMTLIEAALSRCPIVTTDVGVVGEVLKEDEHVLVCPKKNGLCLHARAEEILSEDIDVQSMTKKARKTAQEAIPKTQDAYLKKMKKCWEVCGSSV